MFFGDESDVDGVEGGRLPILDDFEGDHVFAPFGEGGVGGELLVPVVEERDMFAGEFVSDDGELLDVVGGGFPIDGQRHPLDQVRFGLHAVHMEFEGVSFVLDLIFVLIVGAELDFADHHLPFPSADLHH